MLLAYIDEFGHIGPYISSNHQKFKDHPVFGYAGFIIPAHNVRPMGAFFESLKTNLLAPEIKASGKHPRRWEKKGASLLTGRNMEKYGHEISPALKRLFKKLYRLQGKIVFVGQIKPIGSKAETGESTTDRSNHVLRQIITEIADYADSLGEDVLIFLDSVDTKTREESLSACASFIYASSSTQSVKRVLEAPMQLESHLYGTTQFADWICALLGRATHFHFVEDSEFIWAPRLLKEVTECDVKGRPVTRYSRIQHYQGNKRKKRPIGISSIQQGKKFLDSQPREQKSEKMTHRVGQEFPELKDFYRTLQRGSSG
ncbi:DUF3800 domain-containing protein [Rothia nasimurium]|uniref:DUF3800 domain-containing protein n=1 Tax=Rothia nasimurium TaxID=85336 RepID=A0A4Y9F6U0_9MICC|nr:DUF3800 domain-containing protein [Rothia nasimurium]MBF0807123.1 DUF3800 domain-containing protein [Rothia nasimurium]TFU24441.1 DUF3800 domain-containing protein [Rothia nasimurium]